VDKMKIVLLTREYPPDTSWGGVATYYYSLATALVRRGHEVYVICQAVTEPGESVKEGVFVHRVGTNHKRYSAIARIDYSFHAWQKLKKIIKERNIQIVDTVCWGAEGFLYSLFKSVPLIVRADVSASDILQTKTYSTRNELVSLKVLSRLENFSIKKASKVIACSKVMYDRMVEDLHIAPQKAAIVHHAIDTDLYRFTKSDVRHRLGIPDDQKIVLAAGRLEARKGILILCKAIPEIVESVPEIRFILVGQDTNTAPGGGSMKSYVIEEAKSHDFIDNLMFVDPLPQDELVKLYSACDVFVFASLYESFGLVVAEAMACSRLVVATSVGIIPELANYNCKGLSVVPVGYSHRLAEAAIKFLKLSSEATQKLGNDNQKLIKPRLSIRKWIDSTIALYEDVIK